MNILVACEESQEVCKELRKRGHRAFSCDIQGLLKSTGFQRNLHRLFNLGFGETMNLNQPVFGLKDFQTWFQMLQKSLKWNT